MSAEGGHKEHEATTKRLEELREQGQTLRSKDLSSGLILAAAILILLLLSSTIKNRFEHNFIDAFKNISVITREPEQLFKTATSLYIANILMLLPIFTLLIFSAFMSVFLLGGWNFTITAISFKWEKLNPFTNLGNIFSKKMLIDVIKSVVKFGIIMSFFYYFVNNNKAEMFALPYLKYTSSFNEFCILIERFVVSLFMGVIVIIAMDVATSYFTYLAKTKMSTQELKDEQKNTEGNADVKRKLKSLQYSLLRQRIPQMVPQASVIITNPTHYAVALQYREGIDKAPKVIAKGKGNVALYMRQLAVASGVPIYNEPPLARSIYHTTKTGAVINPALYMAVAMVLTYINQLRRYQSGQGPLPARATELNIPAGFEF